jgi:hypothetical protein
MLGDDFRVIGGEPGARRSEVEFELRGAGQSFPQRFIRASEPVLEPSTEAFVACALIPAMASGVGVELAGPASARLLSALPTIGDILTAWNTQLTRASFPSLVPLAKERSSPGRVGAFFSGGVDSFYTFLKHRDEVTDLIFVHGFDIPLENVELLRRASTSVDAVASEFGVGVVHVETNLKPLLNTFVNWGRTGHGAAIATIGHLLAPAFERLYIASSVHFRDLFPWGTHPLLDPLWSSELLEFVHHGCGARRIEKVEYLAGFDAALNNLRVCHWGLGLEFDRNGAYNCGRCEKCIRTMISLEAAGKLSQSKSFDRPLRSRSVGSMTATKEILAFFHENLEALRRRGARPDVQRALELCLNRPWHDRARRRARSVLRRIRGRDPSGSSRGRQGQTGHPK